MSTLDVDKNLICIHKILPKDCFKCQILTFILSSKYNPSILLPNDVIKYVLYPILRKNCKIFTLDVEYKKFVSDVIVSQQNGEYFCNETHHKIGLLPICNDSKRLDTSLRLTFIGSQEAYYGFICCFLLKYCSETILSQLSNCNFINRFDDYEFCIELMKRWRFDFDVKDCCIFDKYPETEACLVIPVDYERDCQQYISTPNINEFVCGYTKMLELNIEGIDNETSPSEGNIFWKRSHIIDEKCTGCYAHPHVACTFENLPKSDSICTANWYYLKLQNFNYPIESNIKFL